MIRHVETIIEYLVEDGSYDFEFFDSKGRLVRCKDCKHCQNVATGHYCGMIDIYPDKDFYCKFGELKHE